MNKKEFIKSLWEKKEVRDCFESLVSDFFEGVDDWDELIDKEKVLNTLSDAIVNIIQNIGEQVNSQDNDYMDLCYILWYYKQYSNDFIDAYAFELAQKIYDKLTNN